MKLLSAIMLMLMATGTVRAQEEMVVQSIRHEFVLEGQKFYEEMTLSYDSEGRPVQSQIVSDATGGLVANETFTYSGNEITTEMSLSYTLFNFTSTISCVYQLSDGRPYYIFPSRSNG